MRCTGWEKAFNRVIESYRHTPFEWKKADCCTFAFDSIKAICGVDLRLEYNFENLQYSTEAGAYRVLKSVCGGDAGTLADQFCQKFNFEKVPIEFTQRGDLLLVESTYGLSLAMVSLNGRLAAVLGPNGLLFVAKEQALRSWRVE